MARLIFDALLQRLKPDDELWNAVGHLSDEAGCYVGPYTCLMRTYGFEPAPKRTRQPDVERRIAIHIAFAIAQKVARTKELAYLEAAEMVKLGNKHSPDRARDFRRRLQDPGLAEICRRVYGAGGVLVFCPNGPGPRSGFLVERSASVDPQDLDGAVGWYWVEGMKKACRGTFTVSLRAKE